MRVARESWILIAVCVADLATTLWFVGRHGAAELNPVMRFYLNHGYAPFIMAKCLLFIGPLVVLEWARRKHPHFVHAMLRLAIVLYVGSYGAVVWRANHAAGPDALTKEDIARIVAWSNRPATPMDVAAAREQLRLLGELPSH